MDRGEGTEKVRGAKKFGQSLLVVPPDLASPVPKPAG